MGKLKVAHIVIAGASKKDLEFDIDINVSASGIFTATLPQHISALFSDAGISLDTNGRRNGNPGFFSNKTYDGLIRQIESFAKEYVSCQLAGKKIVIQYIIQTTCKYLINDAGEIVPNGRFVEDYGGRHHWKQGTLSQHATDPKPFGLQTYVKATIREDFVYLSGKTHTRYSEVPELECENRPNLKWLCGICCMSKPHFESLSEMDYNEDTAEFFINIVRSICALNEKIKDILDPKSIQQLIENKIKLLS